MKVGSVLLVDDEEDFTDVLSQRLEARDVLVETASNGAEALEKMERRPFDIVILDLVMPKMGGLETLRKLREIQPEQQVILLTGRADIKSGVEAIKLGASDVLEKPTEIEQLMEKIREAGVLSAESAEKRAEEKVDKILRTMGW